MKKRIFLLIGAVVCILSLAVLLNYPFPKRLEGNGEQYLCEWEHGEETLSQSACVEAFSYATHEGVYLQKEGEIGRVSVSETYRKVFSTLERGELAEMLSLKSEGMSSLERIAIWRSFAHIIWYDSESFAWDGDKVWRTEKSYAQTVVLMRGELPSGYLSQIGAKKLILRANAVVSSKDFEKSEITEIEAELPYFMINGVLSVRGEVIFTLPNHA